MSKYGLNNRGKGSGRGEGVQAIAERNRGAQAIVEIDRDTKKPESRSPVSGVKGQGRSPMSVYQELKEISELSVAVGQEGEFQPDTNNTDVDSLIFIGEEKLEHIKRMNRGFSEELKKLRKNIERCPTDQTEQQPKQRCDKNQPPNRTRQQPQTTNQTKKKKDQSEDKKDQVDTNLEMITKSVSSFDDLQQYKSKMDHLAKRTIQLAMKEGDQQITHKTLLSQLERPIEDIEADFKKLRHLETQNRSTCKVIQVISENVMRLASASSSTDGQCSISLEPLGNLPTHLNMDTKIENIQLSMENIKRNIEKNNTIFKTTKDKNKELEESTKRLKTSDALVKEQEKRIRSDELKGVPRTDVRDLKIQISPLENRYETICKQHETMKQELKRSEEEKQNLMTRLSQVAGAKLTAGNSSIADLGDKYRPTRISDMFAEIYDSDWTAVMDDILESHKEWTEELVVRHIFIVLQECFRACKRIATEQMKRLCEDMFLSASTQDLSNYVETHVTEIKQLQDARKGTAPFVGKMLKEIVFGDSKFWQNCRRNKGINIPLVSQITASEFGQKCVAICWFMVVQDPEMYIDGDLQPGIQFDREVYKEYTRSGKRVAFSVWPALYLHEGGPLLTKGVAQPCD